MKGSSASGSSILMIEAAEICGPDRPAAVCRELTKRFETVTRGPLAALCDAYPTDTRIKGEIAVVIAPPPEQETASEADAEDLLKAALARLPAGKAAAEVARITGRDRQELFRLALSLKDVPPAGGDGGAGGIGGDGGDAGSSLSTDSYTWMLRSSPTK